MIPLIIVQCWSTTDRAIGEGEGFWDGNITNLQIWNTKLSSSDVTTLYNSGIPLTGTQPQASNLRAWYKLDQSANWEADSTGAWQIPDAVSAYPQSFDFDGQVDDVTMSTIDLGTTHTISLWMKSDGVDRTDYITNSTGTSRLYGPAPTVFFYTANNNLSLIHI